MMELGIDIQDGKGGAAPRPPVRRHNHHPPEAHRKPIEAWPRGDREAWARSVARGDDMFDERGPAAHLRASTLASRAYVWGSFLTYLERVGDLDPEEAPEERLTDARLRGWVETMRRRMRASTIARVLNDLALVLSQLAPGPDWSWIRRHPVRPAAPEIRVSRQPIQVFDPYALDRALLQELATLSRLPSGMSEAVWVRDLTLIRAGLHTGLRSANLMGLTIGQQFIEAEDAYFIYLTPEETKTHQVMELPLRHGLVPTLRRWLTEYRPRLIRPGSTEAALWPTSSGGRLAPSAARRLFRAATERLTGRPLNPHLMRHGIATGLLDADPTDVRRASAMLGHNGARSVNEVYDRSGAQGAHRLWGRVLADRLARVRDDDDRR